MPWQVGNKKCTGFPYDVINHPRVGQLRKYWKRSVCIRPDNAVQPRLFRIVCAFLDRGIAVQRMPLSDRSFTQALREIERKAGLDFSKQRRSANNSPEGTTH